MALSTSILQKITMVKIECAKLGRPSFEKEGHCVISTLQGYTFNSASLQSLHLISVEETYQAQQNH